MATAHKPPDPGSIDYARRTTAAVRASDLAALRRLRTELARAARRATSTRARGVYEGLLAVVELAQDGDSGTPGLAVQSARVEPGSLAARMLLEIAGGVRGANADLADRLDTDQWQLSRAGRRLRDLGLATRERAGRLNGWTLTKAGEQEATRLRTGT